MISRRRVLASAAALPAAAVICGGADRFISKEGTEGEVGFGHEVIFAMTNSKTLPQSQWPRNDWAFDAPRTAGGTAWRDGEMDIVPSSQTQVIHQCTRPLRGLRVVGRWREPRPICVVPPVRDRASRKALMKEMLDTIQRVLPETTNA